MVKYSPLKLDTPVVHRSFMTVTYSEQYSYRLAKCSSPGQMPICLYSVGCQPETMLMPNRPGAMLSIVLAMRAVKGGGIVSTATEAKSWMRFVTLAMPAISVKDSRFSSQ